MENIYFIEEHWYSKTELSKVLNTSDIQNLIVKNIALSDNSLYKFIFVGVISLRNIAFIVLPKIFKNETQDISNNRKTVQTLKKYSYLNTQKFEGIDYFNLDPDNSDCSEMAIADFIINDFQRNGIYIVEQELLEQDGNGDINWSLTVQNTEPLFSRGHPIYLNTINHISIDDAEHLTIEIHKWSIGYCLRKYSVLLGQELENIDFDFVKESNEIGTDEQLITHLKNQLQLTYTDRGIRLLKSLVFLITIKSGTETDSITLYGTKKYSGVWESICKTVTNDIYHELKKDYNFFPSPIWNILGKTLTSKSLLIPDIITLNQSTSRYCLYDAKYYIIEYENYIKGEPGLKDILKQFQYQEHLEKQLGEIDNGFLFPVTDSKFNELLKKHEIHNSNEFMAVIGNVEYHLYPEKKISVIVCPYSKWQKLFIGKKNIDSSKLLC